MIKFSTIKFEGDKNSTFKIIYIIFLNKTF